MATPDDYRTHDESCCCGLTNCTLDKIARVAYDAGNEAHRNGRLLAELNASVAKLVSLYETVHPDAALQQRRLAELEAKADACCPPPKADGDRYVYEPCGSDTHGSRDGWSTKATATVDPERVQPRHDRWQIVPREHHESDDTLPHVDSGPFVGHITPSGQTQAPMDFRSGSGPIPGSGQQPVTFRTFTSGVESQASWPPDMSGAKSGDVVLMSGNLWLKLSVDGGKSFTDLDFTKVFAKEATYGGWAGDQVITYVPEIDCFVLYVQSFKGTGTNRNKSVVKVAIATPTDLKTYKGLSPAWTRQWHFTSDTFGLNAWLDFPDVSFGAGFLYINTNTFAGTAATIAANKPDPFAGKLFFELPLAQLKAGKSLSFNYGYITDRITYGSPTQNITDENYWPAHVGNGKLRIYSSKGTDQDYFWRERDLLANWPVSPRTALATLTSSASRLTFPTGSVKTTGSSGPPRSTTSCGSRGLLRPAPDPAEDSTSHRLTSRSPKSTSARTTRWSTRCRSGTRTTRSRIRV